MSGQIKLLNAPLVGEGASPSPVPVQQAGQGSIDQRGVDPGSVGQGNPAQGNPAQGGAGTGDVGTIEQVRELLYGDAMRTHGRRVEDLGGALSDLEHRVFQRFDELQSAMDAMARSLRLEQGNAIRSIGLAMAEVGRQIAALGDVRERTPSDPQA